MIKADSILNTEAAISARLKRCGMRIEKREDGYVLLYAGKLLLATDAHGNALSLEAIDRHTARFV